MHARELVELACLTATHGVALVHSQDKIPRGGVDRYWTACKCRLDRWMRTLKGLSFGLPTMPAWRAGPSSYLVAVLEEILTGDVLARVWAATAKAHAVYHADGDAETVARSIHASQLDARLRALKILWQGPGVDSEQALVLNRLRRQSERWTDVLLSRLMRLADVTEFSFEPQRTRDFARDLLEEESRPEGEQAWPLLQLSLSVAYQRTASPASPNADLNLEIGAAVLSCFSPQVFDGTGLVWSARMALLTRNVDETEWLLEDFLSPPPGRPAGEPSRPQAPSTRRRFEA